MPIDFSTAALIDSIKSRCFVPRSQITFTDSDLVKTATEELLSDIVPMIMAVKEEYLVVNYDQSISSSTIAFDIPERAVGNKVRDVVLLNSNNREISLPRVDTDQLKHQWYNGYLGIYYPLRGFYFLNDKIILYPDSNSLESFTLRIKYYRRPNNLIETSMAGQIVSIDTGTNSLTLSYVPSDWTTATTFDIVKQKPSFTALAENFGITGINGLTLTFSNTLPTDLEVGNWVSEAGFSPIPQIPYEVHKLLAQRVVIKITESIGDTAGIQKAADVYKDMVDKFKILVTPRADGSPKKIVRTNGPFRTTGAIRNRGYW